VNLYLEIFFLVWGINLLAYAVAFWKQTDHLTDFTYSFSFIAATVYLFWKSGFSVPDTILLLMISFWAIRLGGYLFMRIRKMGRDQRFDEMRPNPLRFLGFWSLQSISIFILLLPVISFYGTGLPEFKVLALAGTVIWMLGFLLESIADYQKNKFKNEPGNSKQFIQSGVWSSYSAI